MTPSPFTLFGRWIRPLIQLRFILLFLVLVTCFPLALLFVEHNAQQKDAAIESVQREGLWAVRSIVQKQRGLLLLGKRFLIDISKVPAIREIKQPDANNYLTSITVSDLNFYTLGIIDAAGMIQASAPPSNKLSAYERYYFQRAKTTGEFTIGEFAYSKITGRKSIHLAYPVSQEGKIKCVLFAAYDLERLGTLPAEVHLSGDATLLVTDRNGVMLYAQPENQGVIGEKISPELWRIVKTSVPDEGAFRLKSANGAEQIYSFKRLTIAQKEGDMYFIVGASAQSAFSRASYEHKRRLVALCITTLLAVTLAWIAGSHLILRHAKKIKEAAGQLAESDLSLRLNEDEFYGEFSLISRAFNNMAKKLEERSRMIHEKEQIYRSLFDSAGDAIMMLNEGKIIRANKKSFSMFGLDPKNMIHLPFKDLLSAVPTDAKSGLPMELDFENASDQIDTLLMKLYRADRSIIEAEATLSIVDISGQRYCQIILHDITERCTIEREKKALEEEYQQAKKMESIGQLAGGVAHDFNNLLTVISGNISLAKMCLPKDDLSEEPLSEALAATDRATSLTRQLLAFSRRQMIEPKPVQLNDLIVNIKKMLDRLIGENIKISTSLAEGLWMVKVDPSIFEQVVVNLAVNARDAMPDGGTLSISTENEISQDARESVLLKVADTGHGMSEEVKRRIFEPFFSTKPSGKGTGLGLAMVFGAVKQAGGTVTVESAEGQGSSFLICLPKLLSEAVAVQESPSGSIVQVGHGKILLVEDEASLRLLTKKMLTHLGYDIVDASDGASALALAVEHRGTFDLLLTDVVMPGMNGRELAEKVSQIYPHIRILFTSGYTEDVILRHGVIDGRVHFIAKPFSASSLSQKIAQIINVV